MVSNKNSLFYLLIKRVNEIKKRLGYIINSLTVFFTVLKDD